MGQKPYWHVNSQMGLRGPTPVLAMQDGGEKGESVATGRFGWVTVSHVSVGQTP